MLPRGLCGSLLSTRAHKAFAGSAAIDLVGSLQERRWQQASSS